MSVKQIIATGEHWIVNCKSKAGALQIGMAPALAKED